MRRLARFPRVLVVAVLPLAGAALCLGCRAGAGRSAVTWTVPEVAPAAADPEQADLVARMRQAPQLRVENLGAPVRTTGGGNIEWVPNPDGKAELWHLPVEAKQKLPKEVPADADPLALIFARILGLALENGALRLFSRSAGIESGDISPHSTILPVLEQAAFLLAPAWEQGGLWSAAKRRRFSFPAERGDRPNAPFSTVPPQDVGKDQPLALGWKAVRFEVPTYPYPIHRVIALPDGRVCGSGGNYLGNFIWDPKTNAAEHKGILRLSHYSSTVAEGKVYMSGYPSSALYVYDADKPWTANDAAKPWTNPLPEDSPASNPRRLTYLAHDGSGCHKMLAAVTGADGKVYFGGRWYRNGEGGGLGWWDIQAAKGGGISLPFRCYQVHHMTTACDGRIIVVSTKAVRDAVGGQPEPDEARLFVFDTATMAIAREIVPVKGAKMTGPVAGVGGPFVLGLTYNPADREGAKEHERFPLSYGYADKSSILYKVNVETGDVVWRKSLPYPVGFHMNENATRQDGFDFRLGPDGKVWTYTGGRFVPVDPQHAWHYSYLGKDLCLVRIEPADGRIEVVGKLGRAGEMAFSGRDLILSGGCKYLDPVNTSLRRVRNVVPHPRPWSLAPNLGVTWYCPRIAKRPTVVPRSACPTVLLPQPARRAPALLVKPSAPLGPGPAVAHPRWVLEQPQEQGPYSRP